MLLLLPIHQPLKPRKSICQTRCSRTKMSPRSARSSLRDWPTASRTFLIITSRSRLMLISFWLWERSSTLAPPARSPSTTSSWKPPPWLLSKSPRPTRRGRRPSWDSLLMSTWALQCRLILAWWHQYFVTLTLRVLNRLQLKSKTSLVEHVRTNWPWTSSAEVPSRFLTLACLASQTSQPLLIRLRHAFWLFRQLKSVWFLKPTLRLVRTHTLSARWWMWRCLVTTELWMELLLPSGALSSRNTSRTQNWCCFEPVESSDKDVAQQLFNPKKFNLLNYNSRQALSDFFL